jgi:hypothetical protein
MQTLEHSLADLVVTGKVDIEEASAKAPDREAFMKLLRERGWREDGLGAMNGTTGGGRLDMGDLKDTEFGPNPPMSIIGLGSARR